MSTTAAPTRVTPDDLLRMGDAGKGLELVNGELREVHVSKESSRVAGEIHFHLRTYTQARQVGWVFPEGTSYRCFAGDPSRVRKPDTSVITLSRMPPATYQDEGHCATVPDLVVEVVSPNDIADEVAEKIGEWLAAGVKVLWEVYPTTRTVRAHRPDGTIAVLRAGDTLTAPDLLPGFACPVADLFRLPGDPGPSS